MTTAIAPTLDFARAADADDPLTALRDEFVIPPSRAHDDGRSCVYLVGNSLGCMPRNVPSAINAELDAWQRLGVDAHLQGDHPWYTFHEALSEPGARLVGALPGEVVFMNALTVNLHLMMVSFYRPTPKRHKIIIEDSAFPSDRYAAASQIASHGYDPQTSLIRLRPRQGERVLRDEDITSFLRTDGGDVALVLLPGVNYLSGQVFDIAGITAAARDAGCAIGWDLAHAAGNIPLHLHDWAPDFACWCSYKYLNAGSGAVSGCFVHQRHHARDDLVRFSGWWGNDPSTRFEMGEGFVPVHSADAWQISNPPIFSMAPLRVSLEQIDRATMDAMRAKSLRLGAFALAMLDEIPGVEVLTPREPGRRGCQLSIVVGERAREVHARLAEQGIMIDFRSPDVLRVAPVPLYNTYADVYGFADALRHVLAQRP